MNWIQTFLRALLEFFGLIPKTEFKIRWSEEQLAPKDVAFDEIAVIGPHGRPKWAVFYCPGKCGILYRLPLSAIDAPRWNISVDWLGRPSVAPSVHQKSQCRAHFWVKAGTVVWCRDSGCGMHRRTAEVDSL